MRKINKEKEDKAIEYLKAFEPEGSKYVVTYSGGKDSDVIRILAELAGVKHKLVHRLTTVDNPQTMRYIHSIPNLEIQRQELNMQQLIVKKLMPPIRNMRYCCTYFKDHKQKGEMQVTGVRRSESNIRKEAYGGGVSIIGKPKKTQKKADEMGAEYSINKYGGMVLSNDNDPNRRLVESCYKDVSVRVNPIVDWTNDDVWDFLHYYGCESNPLYQQGFTRIGCVGCPMKVVRDRKRDFELLPNFYNMYLKTFEKMLVAREEAGKQSDKWKNANDVMEWWLSGR